MVFKITKEQELRKKGAKQFAENVLKGIAYDDDRSARYPKEAIEEMGKLHFMGMKVPEKFGGSEADYLSVALMMREIAKVDASVAAAAVTHIIQVTDTIAKYGSETQKEKYLAKMATGELLGGYAYIEEGGSPGYGRDAVLAEKDDYGYVLSGEKTFVYNGGVADVYLVIAALKGEEGKFAAFLVDGKDVRIGASVDKLGLRSFPTSQVIFDKTPASVLGNEGDGIAIMDDIAARADIIRGSVAAGIAEAALEESVEHCKTRVQFGAPIGKIQEVQFLLAEIKTALQSIEMAAVNAAIEADEGGSPYAQAAAVTKMIVSKAGFTATMNAVQIHGGIGYSREANIERYFRDIRGVFHVDNMKECPEIIIAKQLLK